MPTNGDEPGHRARRAQGTVAVAAAALAGACAEANPVEPGAERYRLERSVTTRPSAYLLLSDTMTAPRYPDRDLNGAAGSRTPVVVDLDLSGSAAVLPVPHGVSHCRSRGCIVSD